MKVLCACEESQVVTMAFRELGHESYSCDLLSTSGPRPDLHFQCDVRELLQEQWDMIIAFPPCTFLSNAGASHLYKGGVLNHERYANGLEAKEFFMLFYDHPCPKIAIENPVPSKIYELPQHTQEIQPWQFGHPVKKKTRLWLKGLPPLVPTSIVQPLCSCHEAGTWFMTGGKDRQRNRAKTFTGVGKAMAMQWGGDIRGKT